MGYKREAAGLPAPEAGRNRSFARYGSAEWRLSRVIRCRSGF